MPIRGSIISIGNVIISQMPDDTTPPVEGVLLISEVGDELINEATPTLNLIAE